MVLIGRVRVVEGAHRMPCSSAMSWTFKFNKHYTTVASMRLSGVVSGAKVTIGCAGKGCKVRSRTLVPSFPKTHCKKNKQCGKPKPVTTVTLTSQFQG
jgi:hypothetical protein